MDEEKKEEEVQGPIMQTFCRAADAEVETPHSGECQRCHNHRSSVAKRRKFPVHVFPAKC